MKLEASNFLQLLTCLHSISHFVKSKNARARERKFFGFHFHCSAELIQSETKRTEMCIIKLLCTKFYLHKFAIAPSISLSFLCVCETQQNQFHFHSRKTCFWFIFVVVAGISSERTAHCMQLF